MTFGDNFKNMPLCGMSLETNIMPPCSGILSAKKSGDGRTCYVIGRSQCLRSPSEDNKKNIKKAGAVACRNGVSHNAKGKRGAGRIGSRVRKV